jgi:hypothetical protein
MNELQTTAKEPARVVVKYLWNLVETIICLKRRSFQSLALKPLERVN